MKIFKRILIGVAIVLAVPLIVALFIKTDFVIEREVVIRRPKKEVFEYLKHLKNQEHYSKWAKIDPKMQTTYRGADGTVGFVCAWNSNDPHVGKSEQEIKNLVDGERIDIEIRFTEPFQSIDPAYLITEAIDENQTQVTSGYRGRLPYPMNLLCATVKQQVAEGIETSLANLKQILEKE